MTLTQSGIESRRRRQKEYYKRNAEAIKQRIRDAYRTNRELCICTKCGAEDAGFNSRCPDCSRKEAE